MHVRVRLAGAQAELVVALPSRLTRVERLRELLRDKFRVPPARQVLLYGGKLLENGYSFHDYNIKLNDVIQLMVKELPQEDKDKDVTKKEEKLKIKYEDTKSNLYAVGDLIDMRDREQGAWFEGTIIGIVKDPEYKAPEILTNGESATPPPEHINGEHSSNNKVTPKKNGLTNGQNINGESSGLKSPPSRKSIRNDTKSPAPTKANGEVKSPTPKKNGIKTPTPKKNCGNPQTPTTSSPVTPSRKRGITDYFSRTPKSANNKGKVVVNGEENVQNGDGKQNGDSKQNGDIKENGVSKQDNDEKQNGHSDNHNETSCKNGHIGLNKDQKADTDSTDVGILYKINLVYDDVKEETTHLCKVNEIRPRARKVIPVERLTTGQTVMLNYNTEDSHEKGYWYDFTIDEIKKHRKSYELIGILFLGPDAIPQGDTAVRVQDNIYAIEEVVPLKDRTREYSKLMTTPTPQRALPLHCTSCRDNEKAPCRECGCYLCRGKNDPEKIILCDECNHGFHMNCLKPPMASIPEEDWYCSDCKRDPNEVVAPGAATQTKKANRSKGKRDWGRGMACVGKTQTCAMPANHFGPIPGVEVGMAWRFRIQLSESGVHRPPVSGIHGRDVDGAYSLVLSGGYEDDVDYGTEFTYTGSGGRDLSGNKRTADQSSDQTLTRENKALARNCAVKDVSEKGGDAGDNWRSGKPVRVVRSYKMKKHFPQFAPGEGIRYDGIYKVVKYYPETGKSGFRVWKYLLRRDDPNPPPWENKAKKYPIIYPDGYLEAEAEKKALKEKNNKTPKAKKRVLRESNHSDSETSASCAESPPVKKRKTRADNETSDENETETTSETSPKAVTKVKTKAQKSAKKSLDKSPLKSPAKSLEDVLNEEQIEAIKADALNSKLWEECLDICKKQGKKQLINHVAQVFLCIICQDIAANPVTTKCQHNFCMSCLKLAFKSTDSEGCPYCRQDLAKDDLEHNEQLRAALRSLMPGYDIGKK